MPSISKDDKTVTWVCEAEDEAVCRVGLQELLDANPGYTPVLSVEDAAGKVTTHTSLDAPVSTSAAVDAPVVSDTEAGEPDYYEDDDE